MDLRIDSDNRITGKEKLSDAQRSPWDHNAEAPKKQSSGQLEFGGLSKKKPQKPTQQPAKLQETPIVKKQENREQASPSGEPRRPRPSQQPVVEEVVMPEEFVESMIPEYHREEPMDPEAYREQLERERIRRKKIIRASVIAAAVFIVGIMAFLVYRLIRVEEIVVMGNEQLSAEYITELSDLKKGQHIFAIDMDAMEAGLSSDPRVEFKGMDYEFPDRVVLNIVECMPVARFEIDGGNSLLIDKNAKAIAVADANGEGLMQITGLNLSKYSIGYTVRTEDTYKQKVLCELLAVLQDADYTQMIVQVDISSTSNLKLYHRTGMEICYGSGEDLEIKTKWAKAVISKLAEQGITEGKVDVYSKDQAIYSRPEVPDTPEITLNYIDIHYDDPAEEPAGGTEPAETEE